MTRGRNGWILMLAMAMLFSVAGCKKKAPQTSDVGASTVPTTTAPTDVTPTPRPSTDDQNYDPLNDPDIAKLNEYLRGQGLLGDVYFEYDRADLREDARERLARNADWLKSHPQFEVTVEGHCDERGTNEYNLSLGERRAGAARDYMSALGVNVSRLRTISYGEERPQCTTSSESCWAQNRRAHFVVTGRGNAG